MEDFEQVKVIACSKQEFEKDGKKSEWWRCEGMSHNLGVFVFSRPSSEEVKVGDIFGMYVDKDRNMKAVVKYRKI